MIRGTMLIGLSILGLALLVGTSASQDKKDKAKGQLPQGWKDLKNLTAAQKEKIYTINAEFKSKIEDLQKKLKELEGDRNKARLAILTDEQRAELAAKVTGEKKEEKKSEKKDDKKTDK